MTEDTIRERQLHLMRIAGRKVGEGRSGDRAIEVFNPYTEQRLGTVPKATLEEVVDHYIAFFTRLEVLTPAGSPPPPPTTTDGVNFDRKPLTEERRALLAYLRKL